jgi:hypothetical protein
MNRLILAVALAVPLFCGCRGVVSEVQKSEIRAVGDTAMVGGAELQLTSELKRTARPDGKGFDLTGRLVVSWQPGTFPPMVSVHHFALKPSWRGSPGYYVVNFEDRHGKWECVAARDGGASFSAVSKNESGKLVIEFTWLDQGRGLGKKPEHFASYDVGVTVTDGAGRTHLLSNLNVPVN